MLCLSRKVGEKIVIAKGLITIMVIDIREDKVRLGIEAPKDIEVNRLEVEIAKERDAQQQHGGVGDGQCDVA